jgi:hypothetical protein
LLLALMLAVGVAGCGPNTNPGPKPKTTLSGSVPSQGLSVVDIESLRGVAPAGLAGQGLSVVDIESVRFDETNVVAVRPDGTVVASSPLTPKPKAGGVGRQASGVTLDFKLEVPSGENVALMLATKGPSGQWVLGASVY